MPLRIAQTCLLALWAAFFFWLLSAGQPHLARILHPRLWWLVAAGAGIVLLFFFVNLGRMRRSCATVSLWWQWPALAIMLVPIAYAYPLGQARLNSDTFTRLAMRAQGGFAQGETMPGSLDVSSLNDPVADQGDIPLTRLYAKQERYLGKPVEVVCQLLKDDALPDGLSICYRFTIFCCAADARPIFVFLKPNETLRSQKTDDWLRVQGELSVHENNGLRTLQVQPERVEKVKEPSFPFVF
ncbi:MAG: hypothetical protein GX087_12225 [Desulfobulbaceae bacterium]|nr:hypothetical protein [Desulfobulbaceae bacterium]